MSGEWWSFQAGSGPLVVRLGRVVRGETASLLKQGFERSTHWAHATTALFIFATDFLKPILPHCTVWVAISALALLVALLFTIKSGFVSAEFGSSIVVFTLVTAILSLAMVGLQEFTGDENGALAKLVPGIERLQEKLGVIETKIGEVKRDTEALRKAQQEEKARAEERHKEAGWRDRSGSSDW